jgi:hypothetical protein
MPGIWKAGRFPLSAKPDPCGAVGLPTGTTKLAGRGKAGMLWNGYGVGGAFPGSPATTPPYADDLSSGMGGRAFGGGSFLSTPALLEEPAAVVNGGTETSEPPMSGPTLACVSFLSASK